MTVRSTDPASIDDAAATGGIGLIVNGEALSARPSAHQNALDLLRAQGLTGAKEGCAEGECGACAVLVARPDGGGTRWTSVNACLIPAAALDGQEVVTAEGLGSASDLHAVQSEMAQRGGSQCGYCTPGFICSMAAEYYRPDRAATAAEAPGAGGSCADREESGHPGADAHETGPNGFDLHALSGNLCRCTGYRPIRDAAFALGAPEPGDAFAERRDRPAPAPAHTDLAAADGRYRRPASLGEALGILRDEPDAKLVAGATDWGVEVNIRGSRATSTVAIDRLPELRRITWSDDSVEFGAALTLSELERELSGRVPLLNELFPRFASRLIRNSATVGGNLGTGSPIGDTPPVLLALEASLVLASASGERAVPLAEYFTGYRQTVRRADELIRAIRIPLPLSPIVALQKIAKRRFDDISSVAVAIAVATDGDGIVTRARIGLGGVAATPLRALEAERALEGRPWSLDTVRAAAPALAAAGTPMDDHRASSRYRTAMLAESLERCFSELADASGASPAGCGSGGSCCRAESEGSAR
ncbi:xanthine dehydrogenase small subunit [Leucobacter zeae]|nr:xanthine dehydrogenase small subunit [Leucobacter zeae]